jgi:hypothetical protein
MNAKDVPDGFPAELTIEQITWAFDVSPRKCRCISSNSPMR